MNEARQFMSQASEDIHRLLLAHFNGDEEGFRAAAREVIKREQRLNHHVFAGELERIVSEAEGSKVKRLRPSRPKPHANGIVPKDDERDANLIELSEGAYDFADLTLAPSLRAELDRIINERRSADLLKTHGVRPISKLLFCGPPGCGKTAVAGALAKVLYLPLAVVRFDAVVSSYLGETAANLRKVFDFARSRPCVLFFDEFDAIGKHRTSADEHGELKRVVNSFLQLLDGFHAETLTIAATNHQGLLDSALWRRFDEILFFPKPTAPEIVELLTRQFRQLVLSKSISLPSLSKALVGFSHADVQRVASDVIKATILADERKEVSPEALHAAIDRQNARYEVTQLQSSEAPRSNSSKSRKGRRGSNGKTK